MATLVVEGINWSGKSSVVNKLFLTFRGNVIKIKLPFYLTPFGRYILEAQLPSKDERPSSIRWSPKAQLALYAANRLEVVALVKQLEIEGSIGEEMNFIVDRSPYSAFFTYTDVLLDAEANGQLERLIANGEITYLEASAISYLVKRWSQKDDLDQREVQFDKYELHAIRILYKHALDIIEEVERYFIMEFLGENRRIYYLDISAFYALNLAETIVAEGKTPDVQESLLIQRLVRQLYLELSEQKAEVETIIQLAWDGLSGGRAPVDALANLILEKAGLDREVTTALEGIDLENFRLSINPRDIPELEGAWEVIDQCLPREVQQEILAEIQIHKEGAKVNPEGE